MIEGLGAALFHFLWQGVLLAMAPGLAMMSRSARVRYAAACAALFAMPVVFAITLAISIPAAGQHGRIAIALGSGAPADAGGAFGSPFDFARSMKWFVPFWMAGVALFYARTLANWMAVRRLRTASCVDAPEEWKRRVDALAARLGIRRAVEIVASHLADVPMVAGFLRPVVFVPAAFFSGMPLEQLEYLLIHELAHVRRFDYAVNLLQRVVEGLLFYHPAVWWVSRVLRTEREHCCDDAVVAMRGDAQEYARVLVSLERQRHGEAMAATGGDLTRRIGRLLNRPREFAGGPLLGLLALAGVAAVAVAAYASPQAGTSGPFRKWLDEDVVYIITNQERLAFQNLSSDEEREQFIEQFWARRDPTPGTAVNEFKEEHYRRIAYANQQFQATIPGWKTDRGRIYITFGPPDEIDSHPAPQYFEEWRYRFIQGIGKDVLIRFEDRDHDGMYRMTSDPNGGGRGR